MDSASLGPSGGARPVRLRLSFLSARPFPPRDARAIEPLPLFWIFPSSECAPLAALARLLDDIFEMSLSMLCRFALVSPLYLSSSFY